MSNIHRGRIHLIVLTRNVHIATDSHTRKVDLALVCTCIFEVYLICIVVAFFCVYFRLDNHLKTSRACTGTQTHRKLVSLDLLSFSHLCSFFHARLPKFRLFYTFARNQLDSCCTDYYVFVVVALPLVIRSDETFDKM